MALQCTYMPDALCNFPAISDTIIREARKNIDDGFRGIVRAYGTVIDAVVQPLQWFLNDLEWLFTNTPWIIVLIVMMGVVYFASRNPRIVIGTGISMVLIGVFGLWNDTMITLTSTLVATVLVMIVAVVFGVWMGRSHRADASVRPVLDGFQTIPSFVYLVPALALFSPSRFTAIVAAVAYAAPISVKLVADGIRGVSPTTVEAARSSGITSWQMIRKVQLPMAHPAGPSRLRGAAAPWDRCRCAVRGAGD